MWNVPIASQTTPRRCWEACGRMMWGWRWRDNASLLGNYRAKAGPYLALDEGLNEEEMTKFYTGLGLRALSPAKGANVRYALAWTPVIVTSVNGLQGHAIVVAGSASGAYTVINPAGIQQINFDDPDKDSQTGTQSSQPRGQIDNTLGRTIWYW